MKKNTYSFLIILFSSEANVMQQYIYILVPSILISTDNSIQSSNVFAWKAKKFNKRSQNPNDKSMST